MLTDNAPRRYAVFALLLILYAGIHAGLATSSNSPLVAERYFGPDSYSRLVRVDALNADGVWQMRVFPRSNAPFGEPQHSTRPFDALLLVGAKLLQPFLGFERGLYWWGMIVSPLLHIAAGLALAWTAAQFLSPGAAAWAMGLFAIQFGALQYAMVGRPDHHGALILIFIVMLGTTARLLLKPDAVHRAVLAGMVAGLALWLSLELMLALAAALAALVFAWIRFGGDDGVSKDRIRSGQWYGLGLLAVVSTGVLVEHPLPYIFTAEYDRLSIVHVVVAALILCFWSLAGWLAQRAGLKRNPVMRGLVAVAAGAIVLAVMFVVFPKFFRGPTADMDPLMAKVFLNTVVEMRSALSWRSAADFWLNGALYLGPLLAGLPYLVRRLWRDRHAANWDAWLLTAIALAIYLPPALLVTRLLPYVGILLSLVLAELITRALAAARGRVLAIGIAAVAMAAIVAQSTFNVFEIGRSLGKVSGCRAGLRELVQHIGDGENGMPLTILAQPGMGPELLYRTRHDVVATPSHRNPGIIAFNRILGTTEDADARRMIAARKVDVIAICRGIPVKTNAPKPILYQRLRDNRPPDWLTQVRLPMHVSFDFALYRIRK